MHLRVLAFCLSAAALACVKPAEPAKPAAATPPVAVVTGAVVPAAPAAPAAGAPAEGHAGCENVMPADPATADKAVVTTDATGATVTAVGAKLAGVATVKVSELLANPSSYAGRTVRLEGNVSAMCTHRRNWFAVQSDDRSGAYVRVIAAPAFLVPEGSIGRKARTEGVVEVSETAPAATAHYEQEHQLAPQPKTVVVRATGAEFI